MIPKEQVKLLEAWRKDLFEELSISEIMGISKKKTKPWVFNSLKRLAKNDLLVRRRKANINLYRLNIDNPFLLQTLQYLDADRHSGFRYLDFVSELIRKIPVRNYCLLAFGGREGLNLCFLVENKEVGRGIKRYADAKKGAYINGHYLTFDEFIGLLLKEGENIGKQIFREHKLFLNADIFYGLVKEAHRNGFRGK